MIRCLSFLFFGLLLSSPIFSSYASSGADIDERVVQAVYLYKLSLVTQWPVESLDPSKKDFTICIMQSPQMIPLKQFRPIWNQQINERPLKIIVIPRQSFSLLTSQCALVFVSEMSTTMMREVLDAVKGHAILTVSSSKGFLEMGGMVQLRMRNGRMVYAISQTHIEQVGLRLPVHVYQLADFLAP